MIALVALVLVTNAACHRVTESVEDLPPEAFFNTTTLYPIANKTDNVTAKINTDSTNWKPETVSNENNENKTEKSSVNGTSVAAKEFKPSPHVGSIEDGLDITPTRPTLADFRPLKKPSIDLQSSYKDQFKSMFINNDNSKLGEFPYKIETVVGKTKSSWKPFEGLDSRPTMQVPMKIPALPAGGLYRSPEAFKEKPGSSGDNDDFGLDFSDLKENNNTDLKKRVNPWKSLLRMMTALIPVGIIISALTPNIITLQPSDIDNQFPSPPFRRSDLKPGQLTPISEPCRRRLLCELHAENNYAYSNSNQSARPRRRPCHKIRCDDPETLSRMLDWLLNQHTSDRKHYT